MGRRKVSLLHWRLLIQILFLSFCVVNASRVLDEVPVAEDSELVQHYLRRRSFPLESDDEDFAASAEGSAELEEGSTPSTTEVEHTVPTLSVIPKQKTVYYRVLVNFTTSIEYDPELENFESETFREVSEGIIDTLESEFYRIPGDQSVTVVWIKQEDQNVIVELDVGSDGNSNDEEIRDVVYSVVRSGSIGPYETSVEGFKFRHLGEEPISLPRECHSNEFACRSGECVPLDYRCDSRADCSDMSDEDDCVDLVRPVTMATTPPIPTAAITPKPEYQTPRPLVPTVPTRPIIDVLRPCPIDKAVCQNGQCIPRDYLCDGERDCIDGSDELDCGTPSPCEPNEFKCKNGRCALKLWNCDGDNDCGDNSDEEFCPTKRPGDTCAPEQFVCVSTQTCIPASHQCDEETDCPDRSDEFGCTPPQVITPPEETVIVNRGATVTLTCVAAGVPTPIITWRLNWGHIPLTSRVTMTSQNGQGTLIIRDVKESDQGAYTCEAINAKGMIFAIPDALLMLKSNAGICSEGHFNVQGSLRCVPCFCFGVARSCESTSRYRSQIHLRFTEEDNFMGVNVTVPAQPVTPPLSTSQMVIDTESGEFQLVDLSRRFLSHDSFWTLPRQFLGNKIDSYGGFLRYKIRYSVARGQAEPEKKADVIIIGNGRKLIYKTGTPQPDVINQKEILFTEDNWQHESGIPVTREDLMMTLADLDKIMIRTKYDNKMASVGLSDIVMDTTSAEFTTLGKPLLVEQCRCPLNYKGLSCETCSHGFQRVLTGPYLGICDGCSCNGHASSCDKVTGYCLNCQHNTEGPHCDRCKAGFFGNPTRGTANDCMPCPCPFIESHRRFSDTCFLDTDERPTCDACSEGYTGRRCEICAPGYEGNPMTPGGKCKPIAGHISNCDNRGMDSTRSHDGSCVCKANVVGRLCDECSTGSFNLDDSNVDGCLKCFCMGISKQCASSTWHRDQIQVLYDERERNLYMLTNMAHTQRITEGVQISGLNELTFANFDKIPRDIYYWVLPDRFKGDKVTSYGGELHYTILHNVSPGSTPITGMPDVILQGNNIFLEHYTAKRPQPGTPSTFSVVFKESAWRRADGQPSTREHLLMALADINVFMIRASYTEGTTESRISQVHMDVAVPHSTGQKQAVEVEECICPEGYKGTSCQECAFGYTRTTSGLYLGMCERCDCNGHSNCDSDTGKCLECQHNTEGLRCEQCGSGFYGNARGGTPNDCRPCPCPGTTASNQFSPTCFLDSDGAPTCDRCPSGYEGRNCERNLTEFCKDWIQPVTLESKELIPVECQKIVDGGNVTDQINNITSPINGDAEKMDNASIANTVTLPTGVTKILPVVTPLKRRASNLRHLMKTHIIRFNRRLTMLEDTGLDLKDGFKHLQKRQDNLSLQLKNITRMLLAPPKDELISDLKWKYEDVDDKLTALRVRLEILIDGFAALAEEISELKKEKTSLTNSDQPDLTKMTTSSPVSPFTKYSRTRSKVKPSSFGSNNKTSNFVSKRPPVKSPTRTTPPQVKSKASRLHRKVTAIIASTTAAQRRVKSPSPVQSKGKVPVKKKFGVPAIKGQNNSALLGKGRTVVKKIPITVISAITLKPAVTKISSATFTLNSNVTMVFIEPKDSTTQPVPTAVLEKPTRSHLQASRMKTKHRYTEAVTNATIPIRVKGKINTGGKKVTKSTGKNKPVKNGKGHSKHKPKPGNKAAAQSLDKTKRAGKITRKRPKATAKPSSGAGQNRGGSQKHKIKQPSSANSNSASIQKRRKAFFNSGAAGLPLVTAQPKNAGKTSSVPALVVAKKISEMLLTLTTTRTATTPSLKRSESRPIRGPQSKKCNGNDPPRNKLAGGRKRKTKKATALDILKVLRGGQQHHFNFNGKSKDLPLYITLGRLAIPIKIIPD